MKYLLLLILWLGVSLLYAQDNYDVIQLKDGSFYKGNITEYIPEDHAVIKLLDGRIITVQAMTITALTLSDQEIIKKNFDIKSKGYFHNSLLGPQFGKSPNGQTQVSFAYDMVNGYRIKGHHPGVGLGIEKYAGNWYAPVYLDYSYHFLKKRFTPMAGVNGGFMIPLQAGGPYDYYGSRYQNGGFVGGRIGFVVYNNPSFGFLLNLTYRYVHLDGAEYPGFTQFGYGYSATGSADLHRIGVMIGFVVN